MNKFLKALLEKILDRIRNIKEFQNYINSRAILSYENIKVYKSNGYKFVNDKNNHSISQVFRDYKFNDIREDDIVLDIGANVGAFSIFVSKFVKYVYAIEPITTDVLSKNIKLNNIKNITIFSDALGNNNNVSWDGETKNIRTKSLKSIIKMCGGHVDFLKLDCEGGEWSIKPSELQGIRRVEAEIHNMNNTKLVIDFLKILDDAGFKYTYEIDTEMIVHATRK